MRGITLGATIDIVRWGLRGFVLRGLLGRFRRMSLGVGALLVGLVAVVTLPVRPALAAPADDQTTYQVDAAHTGFQGPDPMTPPLTQQWSFDAGYPVLNPMIAGGKAFFTADNFLYAKDPKTGTDVWGPVDLGWQGTPTYDGGRIFVSGPWGMLRAFDAASGSPVWTVLPPYDTSLPYVYQAPVAYKGVLYISGAQTGGAVSAVRETDGSVIWTHSFIDSVTLPAVTDAGVYVSHGTQWAYDLNPATGATIWTQTTGTQGGGSRIDALYGGRDYVEDAAGSKVFDAGTGTPIAYPFPNSFSGPAFDGSTGFFIDGYSDVNGGVETLKAQDLVSGAVKWSFTGDNGIDSPPLVVNGYLYERSKSGNLYAVRESDGSVAWTGNVGANTPWYQSTPIAAGESLLLVPSGNKAILLSGAQTVFGTNTIQPPPSPNPAPVGAVPDVAYQVNSAHEGNNPDSTITPPLSKRWSRDFGHQVSYALVANQHLYVISADGAPCYTSVCGTNPAGDQLWALDESTGATVWGPVELGANRWFANAVFDQGRILTANDRGDVAAYDAGTGARLWTRPVQPYQPLIDGIPVARNGIVYVTDQTTSRLYAIRETDGADLWSMPSDSGEGAPAVTDSAVYVTHACDLTRAFNPTTGAQLWRRYNGCTGGGGTSPAVHTGAVFVRSSSSNPAISLDAGSGSPLAGFTADGAPAFDGNLGFFPFLHQYGPKTLRAEVTVSSRVIWSFIGDGSLISDPIVVNGVVYIGSASGTVYGLREADGSVAWSDNAGQPLTDSHEWNWQAGTVPVAGLSAGDGLLLVPATNLLVAYATSPTPTPTPTPSPTPTPTPTPTATPTPTPTPSAPSGGSYHPLNPSRIVDTRDGTGGHLGALGPGQSLAVQIAGRGGVPLSGASAVVLNVTATDTSTAGYLTVYPSDVTRPTASNLNWAAGQTVPNLVEIKLGQDGAVKIYNAAGTSNVVIDVEGWVATPAASTAADGWFNPLVPARLLDTRDGTSGPIRSGGTLTLQVAGRGGVPLQGGEAIVINVTATNATTGSFLTVWPDGTSRPTASNLNFVRGQTIPNRVAVKLGPTGKIDIYNAAGWVDAVVDVNGWFTDATPGESGNGFVGVTPTRILDTRDGTGGPAGPLGPGSTRAVAVAGANGIPSGATAVVANVTVTDTTGSSYLTAWPDGESRPNASDLNWIPGVTIPNLVVVKLGASGRVDLYNAAGSTDVILDVVGYYR